jgi:hypothetical protein
MRKIMPIISQCGEEMEWIIKKAFTDFDIDGSGYLERGELRLLFNLTSDRLGVERPDDWQVDYIISLIDNDGNSKVCVEEMVENYRVVAQELFKNKKVRRNRSKDFFNEVANPDLLREKDPVIVNLGNMAKEFIKNTKEQISPEASIGGGDVGEKLDKAGKFARDTAKKLIPLSNMLNSIRHNVEAESDEEKPIPDAVTVSDESENDDDGDGPLGSDRKAPYQEKFKLNMATSTTGLGVKVGLSIEILPSPDANNIAIESGKNLFFASQTSLPDAQDQDQ